MIHSSVTNVINYEIIIDKTGGMINIHSFICESLNVYFWPQALDY